MEILTGKELEEAFKKRTCPRKRGGRLGMVGRPGSQPWLCPPDEPPGYTGPPSPGKGRGMTGPGPILLSGYTGPPSSKSGRGMTGRPLSF